MSRTIKIIGIIFILLSIIAGGIGLSLDLWWAGKDKKAKIESENALVKIEGIIEQNKNTQRGETETLKQETGNPAISSNNSYESGSEKADSVIRSPKPVSREVLYELIPKDPVLIEINGDNYIGVIEVPAFEIKLPVITTAGWNPAKMDIAPCIYSGNFKSHNVVIMAHNYQNHFRPILNMFPGQIVIFTTMDGVEYTYTTTSVDVFGRSEKTRLYDDIDNWDLSLFTCVPETYNRCAVRCKLINVAN